MTDWERYPHFDLDYQARDEDCNRRMEQRERARCRWELPLEPPGEWPAPAITVSWQDRRGAEGPERQEEPVEPKPAVMDKRQLWLEFERIA
jgi:hypothetical protein